MNWFVPTVTTGITAFVATNIDDIVILMLLFSQVDATLRPKHIIAGQYLGFTVLVAASMPGFLGGFWLPKLWLGLLGLVPIGMGIRQLVDRKVCCNSGANCTSDFGATDRCPLACPPNGAGCRHHDRERRR